MANEIILFGAALVLALLFFGFVIMQGGNAGGAGAGDASQHQIDESIPQTQQSGPQAPSADVQVVKVRASARGYDNPRPVVKAGVPVLFEFTADRSAGCCAQVIVDGFGVNLVSRNGQTVSATFTPPSAGEYKFHCGMNMCRGVLVAE
jgi:plastocyanin domain-containing protein